MEKPFKILVPVLLSGILLSSCKKEPVVTLNLDESGITSWSAIIKGRISKVGASLVTECGFYWGDDRGNLQKLKLNKVTPDFSATLTGLAPQTTYYFKAYAVDADGEGSGGMKKFTTGSIPPLWQKTSESFTYKNWPKNIVITDSLNMWVTNMVWPYDINIADLPVEVHRSNDGGVSWSKSGIPGSNKLSSWSLSAVDGNNAWITVNRLGLFRTTNGGSSWSLINSDDNFKNHPVVVHFFDSNEGVGYVVPLGWARQKDSFTVIKTLDGGLNWYPVKLYGEGQKIPGEITDWLRGSISAVGDTVAFGSLLGRIFMSYDRGNTWKILQYTSNPYIDCISLAMLSSKKFAFTSGYMAHLGPDTIVYTGNMAKIISTVDGGKTWTKSPTLPVRGLSISPIPGSNIYIASSSIGADYSGKTYISADAGKSFTEIDTLFTSIGIKAFYSIYHGLGCSNNDIESTLPDRTNFIYRWSPELLFSKGILRLHPDSLIKPPSPVKIYISGIRLLKNDRGESGKIEKKSLKLRHDQNSFLLEFDAMNQMGNNKVLYRSFMEGPQKKLTESLGRAVEFHDLKPGNYLFRANTKENDGSWGKSEAKLNIEILPPLWKRVWFTGSVVPAGVLLLFLLIRYRERNLRKRNVWLEGQVKEKTDLALMQRVEFEKMKSHFYTNISHDFRTPLTLINSSAKEIETISEDSRVSKFTGTIFKSSARLLKLVEELLDLSKVEAGKLELKVSEGNLSSDSKFIWQTYLSDAERRGLKYSFHSEPETITCWFDVEFLSKILHNLISNALKFTPKEGEVTVAIKLNSGNSGTPAINIPHPFVSISVHDTGKGISQEHITRIFERFYHAESSDKREQEGTGIGLSIVHEMVKRHHGEIRVDSEVGRGSVFSVFIPAGKEQYMPEEISSNKTAAIKTPATESPVSVSLKEPTPFGPKFKKLSIDKPLVLVVEDNDDLREFLSGRMSKAYRVEEAVNGKVAIEKARELQPDIIISDIMMPVMDGVTMCAEIKNNPATCHIPVILLTAKADIESRLEGLRTGADDYLTKPFNEEELTIRTDNLLRQRQILREKFLSGTIAEIPGIHKGNANEEFMTRLISYLEKNLIKSDLSTGEIASAMSLGSRTLLRKIETLTGMTTTEFIRVIRIKHAAALIADKKASITQAAYATGFTNPSYFTRTFKAVIGVSPSEYLK